MQERIMGTCIIYVIFYASKLCIDTHIAFISNHRICTTLWINNEIQNTAIHPRVYIDNIGKALVAQCTLYGIWMYVTGCRLISHMKSYFMISLYPENERAYNSVLLWNAVTSVDRWHQVLNKTFQSDSYEYRVMEYITNLHHALF